MRWRWCVWCQWWALWGALLLGGTAGTGKDELSEIVVSAVSLDGEGDVLAEVVRLALSRGGVRAAVAGHRPAGCSRPDIAACVQGTLGALAQGAVSAALVPFTARVPPALALRDTGLEELGDAAPPSRRACLARPPARSLLDLADLHLAPLYRLSPALVAQHNYTPATPPTHSSTTSPNCDTHWNAVDESCKNESSLATIVTDDPNEAKLLTEIVGEWGLLAHVVLAPSGPSSDHLFDGVWCTAARDLRPLLRGGRRVLAPPPCTTTDCPFESRRLVKLVNARQLAHSQTAYKILGRIVFKEQELIELIQRSHEVGAETAAREFMESRPRWAMPTAEVRVAVIVPASTLRHVQDARALRAAAELAERDLHDTSGTMRFKVELVDGACATTPVFKYLQDAPGEEFGSLSAVAGPACSAPFADVARQRAALALPLLAYTPQPPPPTTAARLTLLAAGDATLYTRAWAALLARFRWRRVAILSEVAMRPALEVTRLQVDNVLVHIELASDVEKINLDFIKDWAERAVRARARVLLVCVEDARVVRAAVRAGRDAGLDPAAVWLLPPAAAPPLPDASFSFMPAWLAEWQPESTSERADWSLRWRALCARGAAGVGGAGGAGGCTSPPASAALLYDVLRLWAAALRRLLTARPAAHDDLHQKDLVGFLVDDAVKVSHLGLTGAFNWTTVDESKVRISDLILVQWNNGTGRRVGAWSDGQLRLDASRLHWNTSDRLPPDDGTERCALQPLADLLRADCRVAFVVLATVALAAAAAALAVAACHCRRRADREHRARLAALGLRALAALPAGLDKWEVPRERVVINRKLGTGAFGTVYGGHALLDEGRGWSAVAVKTLKAGATTEEKLDFLSEAEAMKRFDHKNVVRLLGVVTKTEPVCTVMEFMLYGDLKNYLLARRHLAEYGASGAGGAAAAEVCPQRLTAMALDVARALSYLAQLRYVHRDVAARNCLISANRVVKLADFGMTRLVFENDYYRFSRKGMLPVRWMAPESLALGVFSAASDVWSFGVLLYEIVTFGALPFQGLSNSEVLARVKAGHTLDLPAGLKPQLEGLMKSCWQRERRARPTAAEVAAFLAEWSRLLTPCTDAQLDALSLEGEWRARGSWGAPLTDTTYLSSDPPRDTDAFLPP